MTEFANIDYNYIEIKDPEHNNNRNNRRAVPPWFLLISLGRGSRFLQERSSMGTMRTSWTTSIHRTSTHTRWSLDPGWRGRFTARAQNEVLQRVEQKCSPHFLGELRIKMLIYPATFCWTPLKPWMNCHCRCPAFGRPEALDFFSSEMVMNRWFHKEK